MPFAVHRKTYTGESNNLFITSSITGGMSCRCVLMVLGILSSAVVALSPVSYSAMLLVLVPVLRLVIDGSSTSIIGETFWGMWFFMLSLWVGSWCVVVDYSRKPYPLQGLVLAMAATFATASAALFYFLLEASLVPIGFMILVAGSRPERVTASVYMILFTLVGGAAHLAGLMFMYFTFGSLWWFSSDFLWGSPQFLSFWVVCIFMAFCIKAPLYGVHFWLPKAHVEASTAGSMMLAAIMLKMGIYGMYRYSGWVGSVDSWNSLIQSIGLAGGVMAAVVAMRVPDIKSIIAYSSVSHMSLCCSAIMVQSSAGVTGAMLLGVAHGMSSSGLFSWAGGVMTSFGIRSTYYFRGMRAWSLSFSLLFVGLFMFSCGVPPLVAFFSEVIIWWSLFSQHGLSTVFLLVSSGVVGAAAYIVTYIKMVGQPTVRAYSPSHTNWLIGAAHLLPGVLLFFFPASLVCN